MRDSFIERYWLNRRVIVITNGFEVDETARSYFVGRVVEIGYITAAQSPIPIVEKDETCERVMVFGVTMLYSEEVLSVVKKLSARERYCFIQSFTQRFSTFIK